MEIIRVSRFERLASLRVEVESDPSSSDLGARFGSAVTQGYSVLHPSRSVSRADPDPSLELVEVLSHSAAPGLIWDGASTCIQIVV